MTPDGSSFHTRIAGIALRVASEHGFALGGGCALVAHGVLTRPTEDVDLFTDKDGGVRAARELVRDALMTAGMSVTLDDTSDLTDLFDGFDDAFAELTVSDGTESLRVSLARMGREHAPVVMEIGPVMHLDDLVGAKMCALATRAQIRDFIDVAAVLDQYSRVRLVQLALVRDPSLADDDFSAAMRRLDSAPDAPFTRYGRTPDEIARMRERFADWPR